MLSSFRAGHVQLHGLKLRKESLAKLDLPIEVFEGYLGSLNLEIPWASLKTRPVIISISDLFILAGPKTEMQTTREEELEAEHRAKMERVETAEMMSQKVPATSSSADSPEDASKNDTFVSQLVTKIIDNLQVMIKNIHIRYEDSISNKEAGLFAVGLMLSELRATSTDADWKEAYIAGAIDCIYKLASLDSLALYWMPRAESLRRGNFEEFRRAFTEFSTACAEKRLDGLRYIVRPVSGIGKVVINKRQPRDEQTPRILINLLFNSIDLELDREQYYDALNLTQFFVLLQRASKVQTRFHFYLCSFAG